MQPFKLPTMIDFILFKSGNRTVHKCSLIIGILLSSTLLSAQNPRNFSGVWAFDVSKSNAGEGGSFPYSNIVYTIKQNPVSISIETTTFREGSENIVRTEVFNLDGKEQTEKNDYSSTKKLATWSQDKNILTLTTIMTVDSKDYRDDAVYKISDNGRTLTVRNLFKNPTGKSTVIQVFNKR